MVGHIPVNRTDEISLFPNARYWATHYTTTMTSLVAVRSRSTTSTSVPLTSLGIYEGVTETISKCRLFFRSMHPNNDMVVLHMPYRRINKEVRWFNHAGPSHFAGDLRVGEPRATPTRMAGTLVSRFLSLGCSCFWPCADGTAVTRTGTVGVRATSSFSSLSWTRPQHLYSLLRIANPPPHSIGSTRGSTRGFQFRGASFETASSWVCICMARLQSTGVFPVSSSLDSKFSDEAGISETTSILFSQNVSWMALTLYKQVTFRHTLYRTIRCAWRQCVAVYHQCHWFNLRLVLSNTEAILS